MGFFEMLFGNSKSKSKAKKNENTKTEEVKVEAAAEPEKVEAAPVAEATPAKTETPAPAAEKASVAPEAKAENKAKTPKAKAPAAAKPAEKVEAPKPSEEPAVESAPAASEAITGRFEINRSKDGSKFFFNLYASNKVGIATSQMYSSAQSAMIGVKSVIANAATAPIEDQSLKKYDELPFPKWIIYVDKGGKYRFHLCATNGSNVCHSQGYTTKAACKNGIDSIIRSSKNPEIEKAYLINK